MSKTSGISMTRIGGFDLGRPGGDMTAVAVTYNNEIIEIFTGPDAFSKAEALVEKRNGRAAAWLRLKKLLG